VDLKLMLGVRKYTHSPLVLFIVQAFVIVALSRLLHFFLRYLRQPKVIAEVIAGILIGPSAMGGLASFRTE
jgi:Kef-type K+ transport system membrane component KefB